EVDWHVDTIATERDQAGKRGTRKVEFLLQLLARHSTTPPLQQAVQADDLFHSVQICLSLPGTLAAEPKSTEHRPTTSTQASGLCHEVLPGHDPDRRTVATFRPKTRKDTSTCADPTSA